MARWLFSALFGLSFVASSTSLKIYDLSEANWTLTNTGNDTISIPAHIPSVAHIDLHAAGVIGDPSFGLSDFTLRWVTDQNWTYATTLPQLSNASSTWLLFNGLDTFTSIELCGDHVASTNNQFRQYWFDVSNIVDACKGDVELSINFGSAPNIANAIAAEPGQETWPYGVEIPFEFPNRQFIRKEQNDFGWDWGPAFAPAGVWQPAFVVQLGSSDIHVRNSVVDVFREGQYNNLPPDQSQDWVLNASVDYFGAQPKDAKMRYILMDSSHGTIAEGRMTSVNTTSSAVTGLTTVPSDLVELWWPSGLGKQSLYYLRFDVLDSSNATLASVEKRIGFRTIVCDMTPISEEQLALGVAPGNNWKFEINGHEFYAKGSNFIPPDPFWPNVTEARIRKLFTSAVEGNQNMLRVWSSGAYSPDYMFDVADEMGLLLWSEFEFGDALYPANREFLDNVREEAVYNVRRVNHHPSLALWAGGNELESLELETLKRVAPEEYPRYLAEFEALFISTLLPCVFENTKSISYTPSSTGNGWISFNSTFMVERYDNKTAGSIYGDTDYYNYNSALAFNTSSYPIGRFSNEFGYHSMPSLPSWRAVLPASDLHFNSTTIQLRNRHYPPGGTFTDNFANTTKGMGEMTLAAQRWYPVPNKTDPVANFTHWIYATQCFQNEFYRSQIQWYRRGSGMPERQLGSLYWQLEDQWTAPTWAGIETDGRWKMLHYGAKDAYEHVIISPFYDAETGLLEVYVTSDLWSPVSGTANLTWMDWSGDRKTDVDSDDSGADLDLENIPFTIGPLNTTKIYSRTLHPALENTLLKMSLSAQGTLPNADLTILTPFTHENWFHPTPLSVAALVDPGLRVRIGSRNTFIIEATRGVAAYVWLEHPQGVRGVWSQNGFWLERGGRRAIVFREEGGGVGGEWMGEVKVWSLWDNGTP
ncbi:glycoside hydrolase family 2 protein [Aulographum hederae CBS 113979]|uniref:Beta-mannosidase A n=1 Tax=Aulographum hederae CBS 113979 TaxID=1176131 RepID=A0A6G1HEA5_9PEZI|nr:glycoside hydrolase family 2 protein [Aulographum hederae CBS 113979]